ncbi:glucose-6-phosphate isomerase [[Mycoplasma] mobile]|uniref:Glucose-6-phosphate isomerase n=1 Tax=Mycoplasma mobile (strain ATCC 43663 / 163K / NCTC 11711) TaxID=267748 RepID=G6PI_MYCM1|nr:glucose-6-phosphate isomerase [[Mycoplasma] mobile]Q6KH90.1 RecName: Full=Glucose-6-phosphate isomerase; Short=GPI; AltName: Full=Phosphoglucose isomerase; Short=PGI; AltName: Full=Phosphohexose isomerase; Short=PHI [Mycoplasma mobile 163K]AAT28040.1 glucose-6-phosphate isomerase [Mycoplasma mobile 163K]
MEKIKLNLLNAIDSSEILNYKDQVKEINEKMNRFEMIGSDFLGWKDLPNQINWDEFLNMEEKAKWLIKENVEILVVIGIGGSYLGARAAIEFVNGTFPLSGSKKLEIIYAGTNLSSTATAQLLAYVENKKFAINIISKSGTTLEPSIAFRFFRELLEKKVGKAESRKFIIATTDANKGLLREIVRKEGYTSFIIPDDVGGRYSVLTPVGLFPMLCAGLNVREILVGAQKSNDFYKKSDLEENIAYQYAVARHIMHTQKKYAVEVLISYEPYFQYFLEWWKQLFGETEGKNELGLYPSSKIFSTDLHSLGQFIQEGSRILFETVINLKKPKIDLDISEDKENFDGINYLVNKTLHGINVAALDATVSAHTDVAKVPNIILEIADSTEETLGWLFMFFERACAMSAYLLNLNPFNQPGVEVYKANMFKILGKPKK